MTVIFLANYPFRLLFLTTLIQTRRHRHEADVPTQRHQAQAQSRIPGTDGDAQWPQDTRTSARQGAGSSDAVASMTGRAPGSGFPRSARLTESRDFHAVFAGARRFADRHFTLLAAPGSTDRARLGLAVSRKAAPRAIDRNRLKRLIRESFRHQQGSLPPLDVVVMVRPLARQTESATLSAALDRLWQRIIRECAPS